MKHMQMKNNDEASPIKLLINKKHKEYIGIPRIINTMPQHMAVPINI